MSLAPNIAAWSWVGSQNPHLDQPAIALCERVVIGCYGGCTAAHADKNEDGALIWCADDGSWEFAALLDGHNSAESVELVVSVLEEEVATLQELLCLPVETVFTSLHQFLLSLFSSPAFRARCRQVRGETACLICVRKDQFLWWLCIGDCPVYLLHPDQARLKQFALNQRSFFEWVGQVNTFALLVACYA